MQRTSRIRNHKTLLCFVPVLLFICFGWFLFIIGFGWLNNHPGIIDNLSQALGELYKKTVLSYWVFTFGVPIFCIVYVIYALSGHWTVGAIAAFIGTCCAAFGGAVLQDLGFGITIAVALHRGYGIKAFINYDIVALCGAFLATLALAISVALIPVLNRYCFRVSNSGSDSVEYNALRDSNTETYSFQGGPNSSVRSSHTKK